MRISRSAVRLYALAAGLSDGVTGLLIVISPGLALSLMQIAEVPEEVIYLRFVGVFVGAIGLSYFLPFLSAEPEAGDARLGSVFAVTGLMRLCVAAFVLSSVLAGALVVGWLLVFVTDLSLALLQIFFLRSLPLARNAAG